MSAEEVAKAFIPHYYNVFDTAPQQLAGLFTPETLMTWEGNKMQGAENIVQKITEFGQLTHKVKTIDIQPSSSNTAIFIFVTGAISIGGGSNDLHFCEWVQLVASGPNQFHITHSMFRLNYGL